MTRARWFTFPVGLVLIGVGVATFLERTPDPARRFQFVQFVVGADLVHDLVVAPAVALVALVIVRHAAPHLRAPLRFGLAASAVLTVLAAPGLAHTAAASHNPTVQRHDYAASLTIALAVVWSITAVWSAARAHIRRRGRFPV